MGKSPAFQFYANDWLGSTRIALMSPAQEGAYIRLLCHAWNDHDCSIPADDEQLAVLSRLGADWLKGGSTLVKACFQPHPHQAGRLYHPRLAAEREKQRAWREKSRAGGLKSARARRSNMKGGSRVVKPPYEPKLNSSSSSSSSNNIPLSGVLKSVEVGGQRRNGGAFWAAWVDACRKHGRTEPPALGPDLKAAKTLAGHVAADELARILSAYLSDQDPFLSRNGHALRHLPGRLDGLRNGHGGETPDDAADRIARELRAKAKVSS